MPTRPIIALDFPDIDEVKQFLALFKEEELYVKVGMELYYQTGPEIIGYLKSIGHSIFLDLKLHDIPNTVGRAVKGLSGLGIDMLNVHAAGGTAMLEAAREGVIAGTPAGKDCLKLIAVTQLTSTSQEVMQKEQLINVSLEESVLNYARLAKNAGLDGVVCAAQEAQSIKEQTGMDFLCVTPGIRPEGTAYGDQKRVMTPQDAREAGSSYIVVGRPVTQSADPFKTYQLLTQQWNGVKHR